MAELTTKGRKRLEKSKFALPDERKYPINDKQHASNAKARATQEYKKGNISKSTMEMIHRKADEVLKKK